MPNITLTLDRAVTGTYSITFIESFVSDTGTIITTDPYTVAINNALTGVLTVPSSKNQQVSALIECYEAVSYFDYYSQSGDIYGSTDPKSSVFGKPVFQHTDTQWYTGTVFQTGVSRLLSRVSRSTRRAIINPFNTVIPLTAANVKDLYSISATSTQADTSVLRLAEMIVTDPNLKSLLPKGLDPKGAYNSSTFYIKNDAVTFNGALWIYEAASSLAGQTPGVGSIWREYVSKGTPGGTGANQVGFSATSWGSQTVAFLNDAAARGDLLAAFNSVATPDLSTYATQTYANSQIANNNTSQQTANDSRYGRVGATNTWSATQTFTGAAIVQDRTSGDNTQNVANTKFVQSAVTGLNLPLPIFWGQRSTDVAPVASTFTTIDWDSPSVLGSDTAGAITLPATGRYLAISQVSMRLNTTSGSSSYGRMVGRLALFQNGVEIGDLCSVVTNESFALTEFRPIGIKPFTASANDLITVRFMWFGQDTLNSVTGRIIGSVAQNFFMLFRIN